MLLAYSGVQSRKLKQMLKGLKKMFKDGQVDKPVCLGLQSSLLTISGFFLSWIQISIRAFIYLLIKKKNFPVHHCMALSK